MCKIAIFPYIKEGKETQALLLAQYLTENLTQFDRDGFGYIALGDKGVFGERWLDPNDAWDDSAAPKLSRYEAILQGGAATHNAFGMQTKRIYSMALHSRMATCGISLQNVHPFVSTKEDVALIHNGVISNAHTYKLLQSTCDSEAILQQYQMEAVPESFKALHHALKYLEGWYAVAAYSKNEAGVWHLDIFKEYRARLYAAWVHELECAVFVTDPDHLKDACSELKLTHTPPIEVLPNVAMRTNAMTGEVLEYLKITPAPMKALSQSGWQGGWDAHDQRTYDESIAESDRDRLSNDDAPSDVVDFMNANSPFHIGTKRGY